MLRLPSSSPAPRSHTTSRTSILGLVPSGTAFLGQRPHAALYERFWRPFMVVIMRLHGISIDAERQRASDALHLVGVWPRSYFLQDFHHAMNQIIRQRDSAV